MKTNKNINSMLYIEEALPMKYELVLNIGKQKFILAKASGRSPGEIADAKSYLDSKKDIFIKALALINPQNFVDGDYWLNKWEELRKIKDHDDILRIETSENYNILKNSVLNFLACQEINLPEDVGPKTISANLKKLEDRIKNQNEKLKEISIKEKVDKIWKENKEKCNFPPVLKTIGSIEYEDTNIFCIGKYLIPILEYENVENKTVYLPLQPYGYGYTKCKISKIEDKYFAVSLQDSKYKWEIFYDYNWHYKDELFFE